MTKQQIEAFKKITPGPWSAEWDDSGQWYVEPLGLTGTRLRGDSGNCIESATAIAIAALPELLQEREEMIAALKTAEARYSGGKSPFMEELHPGAECDWCGQCGLHLGQLRRKLIARAEGEEKP